MSDALKHFREAADTVGSIELTVSEACATAKGVRLLLATKAGTSMTLTLSPSDVALLTEVTRLNQKAKVLGAIHRLIVGWTDYVKLNPPQNSHLDKAGALVAFSRMMKFCREGREVIREQGEEERDD